MKITKYVHSCLLVETPKRVALFDPGIFSVEHVDLANTPRLDDIFITHGHPDHFDKDFIKEAVAKFSVLRITAPQEVVDELAKDDVKATSEASDGVEFFDSPHEQVSPLFPAPQEIGIYYLDQLTHPGDSHSFKETLDILALPITAPWGSSHKALTLALDLKPKHVLPIHDWHWRDEAQQQIYDRFDVLLKEQGIKFYKLKTGETIDIGN